MSDEFHGANETDLDDDLGVDKHGFRIRRKKTDFESILISVKNCEELAGLDRNDMQRLVKALESGKVTHMNTYDHSGRTSKKIVIEYDVGIYERTKSDD